MDYQPRLELHKSYNAQHTLERFGYLYPTRPKEKIALNCAICLKEGQSTVNDFLNRIKKKGQYLCQSCGARMREEKAYAIDWKYRCSLIEGYDATVTDETYGYEYPHRSGDTVCVKCGCGSISHQPITEFLRKKERYRCKICMSKQEFSLRQEAMFKARDIYWDDDVNKQKASETAKTQPHRSEGMKRLNKDHDFLEKRRKGYDINRTEIKQAQSEASKKLWETRYEEMTEHTRLTAPDRAIKLKERMQDPLVRSFYSEKGKENWENPDYVRKQKESWTDERKEVLRERNRSPEMLAKVNAVRASTEEHLLHYFFTSLNIEVIPSYVLGYYVFDLYLPTLNILIEFDGMKWHHPDYVEGRALSNIARDKSKTTYVQRHHPNLKLHRINENALYQKGYLELEFSRLLNKVEFSFNEIVLKEVDHKTAVLFLTLFHYKENQRAASGLKLGAYLGDRLIGLAVYSSVCRLEIATSMGLKPKEVIELSRFCIHPCYHKTNFGSWLLGKTREQVKKLYPYLRGIVSFADTTLDHQGTIYKAAGYDLVSEVEADYHYQHEQTNRFMHKRTLWGLAKKMRECESVYANKHGFKKVWGAKKLKFFSIC